MSLDVLADRRLLTCPLCAAPLERDGHAWMCTRSSCPHAQDPFDDVAGVPALVDFERSVLDRDQLRATRGESLVDRPTHLGPLRRVIEGRNTVAPAQVARMVDLLVADPGDTPPVILVIGGGVVGSGLAWLYERDDLDLVGFDIYATPTTQFVADGHQIPLADDSVDGVIVQAVLEHVLRPEVVAAQIERVLRPGGIVYADTPFMQQVHEAAYDFTRFTDSGHRALFPGCERLDSGAVAGAGTALRWSIDYYVRALTRSPVIGRVAALVFFWLHYTDRLLDPAQSLDAASSVFFLGRRTDVRLTPRAAIEHYRGGG